MSSSFTYPTCICFPRTSGGDCSASQCDPKAWLLRWNYIPPCGSERQNFNLVYEVMGSYICKFAETKESSSPPRYLIPQLSPSTMGLQPIKDPAGLEQVFVDVWLKQDGISDNKSLMFTRVTSSTRFGTSYVRIESR
ncbi:hypothetical protein FNV43_RR13807 [Rhamnella rubrinervis]|uniref:Uncharacterized protein n=1 Tax=Rhamnella rubrinervis TaxID=2594499 RepID=A0A8K0H1T9_9ROSA|nr:hypothetical protein FNV43_RR13807 [Rhamnella rubrinervis]